MKTNFLKLILTTLMLTGCTNKTLNNLEVSVLSPTGAPSIAFYKYGNDKNLETNDNPQTGIIPLMVQGKKDVIILPTNAGIQAIVNKNAPYKIAATITFGNLYIASTGHDEDKTLNDGDYIILFQQGQIPDLLFKYLYQDTLNSNVHYVSDASEAAKCLKTGKNLTSNNEPVDYVLIAQPALQNVLNSTPNVSIYKNLQEEYKTKSNGLELFQASIFVNNNTDSVKINSFLHQIEKDINNGLSSTQNIVDELNKVENVSAVFGLPNGELVKQVLDNNNGLGLGYKKAKENKESIDAFLSLFSIGGTNEEIYY